MADNIAITAGTGTSVATDDCGAGGHVQLTKLAISTDGSATLIPSDAANGLDVDVTRLPSIPAGTNNIGDVDVLTSVTPANRSTSGTAGALDVAVTLAIPGTATCGVSVSGTWVGTLNFEATIDGAIWFATNAITIGSGALVTTATANGQWLLTTGGFAQVRVRMNPYTSGTATIALEASAGARGISMVTALPTGANAIGKLAANAGVNIGDVGTLGNGTAAAAIRVSIASDSTGQVAVASIAAGNNNIGDVDVLTVPADPFGVNADAASAAGSISAKLRFIAATGIPVTGTVTAAAAGQVAHDAAVSGNPLQVAGAACALGDTAPANRVNAAADVTRIATSLDGGVFVHPHGPQMWSTVNTGTLTATSVKAAGAAGLSHYVTAMQFSIGAATASSVKLTISAGADVFGPHYLEAINGRGISITFNPPLKITAATALVATTTGSTTCTLNTQGYTAAG